MTVAQSKSEVLNDIFEVYKQETAAAGSDPSKHAISQKRLYKSLRDAGVNEKVVEAVETLVSAFPDNEVKVAESLRQAAAGKVQRMLELQSEQAKMRMNLNTRPEQMKVSIASFATAISTICRLFGANDFAEAIEAKTKEIMDTVDVQLDTSQLTDGAHVLNQAKETVAKGLMNNNALNNMGTLGNKTATVSPATPAQNYPNAMGSNQQSAPTTTWEKYEEAFRTIGLTQDQIDKLKAPWHQDSKLSGKPEVIENGAELTTFMARKEVQDLGAATTQKLRVTLDKLAHDMA
ncbi:MAG: hypothetical protein KDJ26_00230 [Alphaproteobacteria bacterium]|nr:hypothetical protein [Alphaproteobacteria bacterium]